MLRFIVTAATVALFTAAAQARTLDVGPGQQYPVPSAAAPDLQPGDTIAIHPGRYVDCTVIAKNDVTVEGVGSAGQVVMADKACEGKALLVVRGENVTIRNLTLADVRIPDDNGAGIRGESRSILVDGVRFIGNQNGILSGTEGGSMTIRNSLFERNGFCGGACSHGVYVGRLDLVRIENSRFFDTQQAHHIKSRAARTEVVGCDIQDGPSGTASYEIEVPNGGNVLIRGNTIAKGPKSENHTAAIMIGAEGVKHPIQEILVEGNVFRNDGFYPTIFVDNLTTAPARLEGNRISGNGPVRPLKGNGQVVPGK